MQRVIWVSAFLLFCCLASCSSSEPQEERVPHLVEVQSVQYEILTHSIRLLGTIQAKQESPLLVEVQGYFYPKVHSGQSVKKGELLAQLSNPLLEKKYQLAQEQESLAREKYERAQALHQSQIVSKAGLEEARHHLLQAKKERIERQVEWDHLLLYAPFDGVIGSFTVKEGSMVKAGHAIATLYNPADLLVAFDLPQAILPRVHSGQTVRIDRRESILEHFSPILDSKTQMAPAFVYFSDPSAIIGRVVSLDLILEENRDHLVLPTSALLFRKGKPYVYIVEENVAKQRVVQTGLREKERIAIVEGLTEGEQVVIFGPERLYDGMPVTLFQPEP